jgi:ubiquinone/menaquinone biosynthesis C-methylase UbiE
VDEGVATTLPFPDGSLDLSVSNLDVNNFDNPAGSMRECCRVAKSGGVLHSSSINMSSTFIRDGTGSCVEWR